MHTQVLITMHMQTRHKFLHMTVRRAAEAISPPVLTARHEYRPLWLRETLRIFKQQLPLILVMTKSGELSIFWSSLNQDIAGDGMPLTWHSKMKGEPSRTSTDFKFLMKSGGIIC